MTGEDEGVGYRRPPKSGQFRKGQSGNPRGRPRKQPAKPQLMPTIHPTRELLRAEAEREITITDASGRQTTTVRQAIVRSTYLKAMQGGVLAQRTALRLMSEEDERRYHERKERFEFWFDYQVRYRAELVAAAGLGRHEPTFLPHPDDIELDWSTLQVRMLGAVDEEGLVREKRIQAYQDLGYEMAIYTGEDNCGPDAAGRGGRIGIYMAFYLMARQVLPPRLRRLPISYENHLTRMIALGRTAWGNYLDERCRAAEFAFVRWRRRLRLPTIPLEDLGTSSAIPSFRVDI